YTTRFETYVKFKDIDLWQVIQNGDFYCDVEDSETKLIKETPYKLLEDDQKKKLGKYNEAKMTLYNALPPKVTSIKEAKDLTTPPLDELVGNLKLSKLKSLWINQTSDDSDSQDGSDEDIDEEEAEAFNLLSRIFQRIQKYTRIDDQSFQDAMICNMDSIGKYMLEIILHQQRTPQLLKQKKLMQTQEDHSNPILALNVDSSKYDRRVNKRQMQTQESKVDAGKALDANLVDTKSIKKDSTMQDESNMSGNDTDVDDADIRPIYDEKPMAEVQLTAECNIFATGQQHTEQPEIINECRVDQYTEQCQVKSPMLDHHR
ncbi:hypothetical protein Tco_0400850, partial [Tanacetum coccineum]